jgi:hypothetical protein
MQTMSGHEARTVARLRSQPRHAKLSVCVRHLGPRTLQLRTLMPHDIQPAQCRQGGDKSRHLRVASSSRHARLALHQPANYRLAISRWRVHRGLFASEADQESVFRSRCHRGGEFIEGHRSCTRPICGAGLATFEWRVHRGNATLLLGTHRIESRRRSGGECIEAGGVGSLSVSHARLAARRAASSSRHETRVDLIFDLVSPQCGGELIEVGHSPGHCRVTRPRRLRWRVHRGSHAPPFHANAHSCHPRTASSSRDERVFSVRLDRHVLSSSRRRVHRGAEEVMARAIHNETRYLRPPVVEFIKESTLGREHRSRCRISSSSAWRVHRGPYNSWCTKPPDRSLHDPR